MRRCVWSRNLVDEEAIARDRAASAIGGKKMCQVVSYLDSDVIKMKLAT